MTEELSAPRRFDIALSFPGEHRDFVEQVAGRLAATFGKERVLYDKYYEAEFARIDLDVYLPRLYRTQSELIVIFLCPEYAAKRWCNLEWRHMRQLIATVDASRIMLLRYGYSSDFVELGILPGDGTANFEGRPADEIAELIRQRFDFNHGITPPKPPDSARVIPTDISIDKYAPAQLIGGEDETKVLNEAEAKVRNNRALAFLRDEGNRALLGWLGGGAVVVITGLWAAYVHFFPSQKDDGGGVTKVEANCGSVAAQGTFFGSKIIVGGTSSSANCPPKSEKASP
jgi:TIR domain